MRTPSRITLGLAAAAVLAAGMAVPAQAADTTATVAVTPGTLSLTAPAAFDLGAIVPGSTTSGVLSGITVTDERAGELGWVASVSVSDFAGSATSNTIAASNVGYAANAATVAGTAVVAPATVSGEGGAVQTATGVKGVNSATWDADVSITVPADAIADNYTATIVHSVI
ncbi:hypothetical protein [Arthrobacter caoxuetaonis]|uniref:Uncharacterized protein n=1 Tax=Arthrobacter caoxuetaonis TaxID=2886935 RepID=A0A9X1MGT4_9MICC|nr:hypothetical protein [Arthrobacter caoxuetaonis]MCC3299341.1 hypothetical protein [Arthrobacter caoxuetaonis]USQ59166.1 hypothetical protein NF551_18845 [Arthrobacter caoxuetaonis]